MLKITTGRENVSVTNTTQLINVDNKDRRNKVNTLKASPLKEKSKQQPENLVDINKLSKSIEKLKIGLDSVKVTGFPIVQKNIQSVTRVYKPGFDLPLKTLEEEEKDKDNANGAQENEDQKPSIKINWDSHLGKLLQKP